MNRFTWEPDQLKPLEIAEDDEIEQSRDTTSKQEVSYPKDEKKGWF
jgi:hypothetical protein